MESYGITPYIRILYFVPIDSGFVVVVVCFLKPFMCFELVLEGWQSF